MSYNDTWAPVWSFSTPRFSVIAEITDEDRAPDFEDPEDNAAIERGDVAWFVARVRVLGPDGLELGYDVLGGCAYKNPIDVFRDHTKSSGNGGYGVDMVRQAVAEARRAIDRAPRNLAVRHREAADLRDSLRPASVAA